MATPGDVLAGLCNGLYCAPHLFADMQSVQHVAVFCAVLQTPADMSRPTGNTIGPRGSTTCQLLDKLLAGDQQYTAVDNCNMQSSLLMSVRAHCSSDDPQHSEIKCRQLTEKLSQAHHLLLIWAPNSCSWCTYSAEFHHFRRLTRTRNKPAGLSVADGVSALSNNYSSTAWR